jgi:hypothetical protein
MRRRVRDRMLLRRDRAVWRGSRMLRWCSFGRLLLLRLRIRRTLRTGKRCHRDCCSKSEK